MVIFPIFTPNHPLMPASPTRVLPVIVISQFLCTTLWFGGNAIMPELSLALDLPASALASITSAVQFGFISGTLVYTLLGIADRFNPSLVFLSSAVLAALANLGIIISGELSTILVLRFLTGFFLAGIYPVGMKIAADHFEKGLGKALGYLVGALVLGTAFPHLLKSLSVSLTWQYVIIAVSIFAVAGGLIMYGMVPADPHRRMAGQLKITAIPALMQDHSFRSAAFGYFGHMWELYAFWAFVPVFIKAYMEKNGSGIPVSAASFLVIAAGSLACVAAGYLAFRSGAARVAKLALAGSALCCLVSPLLFRSLPVIFFGLLLVWGAMVVADSPMFSTLVAQYANPSFKGTALTMVTCIGFFITILSIELLGSMAPVIGERYIFLLLAPGPLLGLVAMRRQTR